MPKPPLDLPGLLRVLGRESDPAALAYCRKADHEIRYPDAAKRRALNLDVGHVVLCLVQDCDYRLSEVAALLDWPTDKYAVLLLRAFHAQREVYDAEQRLAQGIIDPDYRARCLDLRDRSLMIRGYLVTCHAAPPPLAPWGGDDGPSTHPFQPLATGC